MAKDANAGLDALENGVLEAELPGINVALDRTAMRGHLAAALIGRNGSRVQRCSLTSAILLDPNCVVVRYELETEGASGRVSTALVTGRVYPDATTAAAYEAERLAPLVDEVRGRGEVAAFAQPVAVLDSLGMVVHAFPIDGELPTLVAATDPAVAARAMGELLAVNGRADLGVENAHAEPVHYNRRHRCMLRYHLDLSGGGRQVVYGKVSSDGSGKHIPTVVNSLRSTLANASVQLPECLGYRDDLQLVVFTEIPGVPRVAQLLKDRLGGAPSTGELTLEDAVERCAQIAAALHTSDLRLGPPRPLEVELERLRANLAPILRLSPALAERLGRWLDEAESRAADTPELELCQCHGDFSYTQLIFDGIQSGMVDFDNFCQAEPALDLGQFLAYLNYAGTKARPHTIAERGRLSAELAARFTSAYTRAGGPSEALERIPVYEAINLVRMAEHAWQNLKPRRLEKIVRLLSQRLSLRG